MSSQKGRDYFDLDPKSCLSFYRAFDATDSALEAYKKSASVAAPSEDGKLSPLKKTV